MLEHVSYMTSNLISSNSPRELRRKGIGRQKFIISVDNVRLIGFRLLEDDPEYTEDSFEIVHAYLKDSFFSREAMRVWNELKSLLTKEVRTVKVELRFGTYEVEKLSAKK